MEPEKKVNRNKVSNFLQTTFYLGHMNSLHLTVCVIAKTLLVLRKYLDINYEKTDNSGGLKRVKNSYASERNNLWTQSLSKQPRGTLPV